MEVIQIKENEFEEKVLKNERLTLVDFYADWCGPCKMISPIILELSKEMEDVDFFKINVDNAEDISRKYGVMSIPTLLVFKNGEVIKTSVGMKSKEEIKELLDI